MGSADIDLALLEEYIGSHPAEVQRFLRLGAQSLEQALAPLNAALQAQDLPTLQASGHRAKSTARQLGASGFGDLCEAMERAARAGQLNEALQQGNLVLANLAPLQQALEQAWRDRQPPH